jgi:hypothetical protein
MNSLTPDVNMQSLIAHRERAPAFRLSMRLYDQRAGAGGLWPQEHFAKAYSSLHPNEDPPQLATEADGQALQWRTLEKEIGDVEGYDQFVRVQTSGVRGGYPQIGARA